MNLFFLVVFGFYFILMLVLIIGWEESFVKKGSEEIAKMVYRRLTVVIAFRNEAKSITNIIRDVLGQEYVPGNVELILVDDHSTDDSARLAAGCLAGTSHHLLALPDQVSGKKQAIAYGVAHATGEIIVTTDADCRAGSAWLASVNPAFHDPQVQFVFGGVRIEDDQRFFTKLQALEFCSLVGTAAAGASLGFPVMCNGANLAFRKSAFAEVHGYEGNLSVASGDDEFLMRKIEQRYPGSIRLLADQRAVVTTFPKDTRREFIHQRLRWAGKWPYNTSRIAQGLAVFVIVFQASFLVIWPAPLFGWIDWRFAALLVSIKMISEFGFLYRVSSFHRVKWEVIHFLALQFSYPAYVVYVGIASFFQSYEWKGRRR